MQKKRSGFPSEKKVSVYEKVVSMTEEITGIKGNISVTGSTGHLGSVLIPMLLEQGYSIKCLYRNKKLPIKGHELTWVKGDMKDDAALSELLKGSEAVIHCAGIISVGEGNHDEVFEINVRGTERLIRQCLAKKARLIYISSTTATALNENKTVLNEESPLVETREFFYGWTKARAEELIHKAVSKENLDALVLRPTALIGPPDRGPSRFGKTILDLRAGRLPMISSGGYDMLDIRDFSQTVINSIKMGKAGCVYVTGGRYYSLKELALLINPDKIPPVISLDLLLGLLPLIELYEKIFPLRWPVNRESLLTLKKAPKKVDSSKAHHELRHHSRPLEQSIGDLVEWNEKSNVQ